VMGNGEPEPVYYNGYRAGEDVVFDEESHEASAGPLGMEHMAVHGVQGRGVLVDLFSEFGEFPRKEAGYDDLMRAMEAQQVEVEAGDIFCFWSGLDQMILSMRGNPDPSVKTACAVLDGHDEKLLQWIEDSGIAAIASDTIAVEAVGAKPAITNQEPGTNNQEQRTSLLPLHDRCLFRLGIHLGELWHLAGLAAWLRDNKRNRFLLTAPPLRLPGAVGSPVTPIATV